MSINNIVLCKIDNIISDSQKRLDVLYWNNFKLDFNEHSRFKVMPLREIGEMRTDTVGMQPGQLEYYYPFKITYTGNIVLKDCVSAEKCKSFRLVKEGDLVFSRINCCRGAIGVVRDFQNDAICTNETHIFVVRDKNVIAEYLQIILRHPYYQDLILTKCTGASLERMRFSESALLDFMVPIPDKGKQKEIIELVKTNNATIEKHKVAIDKMQKEKNAYLLSELEINLEYDVIDETFYSVSIDSFKEDKSYRFDYEFNKPSFESIENIFKGKYPTVTIDNENESTEILRTKITSGSTPMGGIYEHHGIKFLQAQNVLEDYIDEQNTLYVNEEFHSSLKRSRLTGNEVLVTIAGTIGRAAVNTLYEANVNQAVAVLRVTQRVNPLYMCAFLNSPAGKIQFDKYRHDFGTPNINQTELGHLYIALPEREIQDNIAHNIKAFDEKIRALKQEMEELQMQTDSLVTLFLLGKEKYEEVYHKDRN